MTYIGVIFDAGNRLRAFPERENASLILIQGRCMCILQQKWKMFCFYPKTDFLGVILCEKLIARITEA